MVAEVREHGRNHSNVPEFVLAGAAQQLAQLKLHCIAAREAVGAATAPPAANSGSAAQRQAHK